MALYHTISEQVKEAMKSGDAFRRDTLRLLQSALKNAALEKRKSVAELSEAEEVEVVKRLVKQRKDSALQYRAGNREELAEREDEEGRLLAAYLPESLSEEALRALVIETLAESGIVSKTAMGQAMGLVMKKVAGRANGDEVRRLVTERLA